VLSRYNPEPYCFAHEGLVVRVRGRPRQAGSVLGDRPRLVAASPLGRPRSPEVIARDERVRTLLVEEGPLTRNQLADRLGVPKGATYLALRRLRDAGLVTADLGHEPPWRAVEPS
jgi:DNA-binding transcriptional ArsR family regulator